MKSGPLNTAVIVACVGLLLVVCLPLTGVAQEDADAVVSADKEGADAFVYSPRGRRDPFRPLVQKKENIGPRVVLKKSRPERVKGPLEKFELSQYRLMAIMVVKGTPRAMVKAPDGKSYTVEVNDYIGMNAGKVKKIETKTIDIDENGMRVEKNPDRIVVEEIGIDSYTGEDVVENRYIVM
jgi:Tfp pilus assembly protein PilP